MSGDASCLRLLRWSARVLSVLAVGIVLALFVGGGTGGFHLATREWILFGFFPGGVCLGEALAWRWEGWGGVLTVGSLAAFYALHRLWWGYFPHGFAFLTLAGPGFLFLMSSRWRRSLDNAPWP